MDTLRNDIRFAIPCLALGIAANFTVFTPINTLLLRPLPFTEPGKVVSVFTTLAREGRLRDE